MRRLHRCAALLKPIAILGVATTIVFYLLLSAFTTVQNYRIERRLNERAPITPPKNVQRAYANRLQKPSMQLISPRPPLKRHDITGKCPQQSVVNYLEICFLSSVLLGFVRWTNHFQYSHLRHSSDHDRLSALECTLRKGVWRRLGKKHQELLFNTIPLPGVDALLCSNARIRALSRRRYVR